MSIHTKSKTTVRTQKNRQRYLNLWRLDVWDKHIL